METRQRLPVAVGFGLVADQHRPAVELGDDVTGEEPGLCGRPIRGDCVDIGTYRIGSAGPEIHLESEPSPAIHHELHDPPGPHRLIRPDPGLLASGRAGHWAGYEEGERGSNQGVSGHDVLAVRVRRCWRG